MDFNLDLNNLKLDIAEKSDEEVCAIGKQVFLEEFFSSGETRGCLELLTGEKVYFFADRFEHAFFTSQNRSRRPSAKDQVARERIERLLWIKPLLLGLIPNSSCWQVFDRERGQPKRLYLIVDDQYVVWLESRKDGDWKFSTAYCAGKQDIQRYTAGGVKIWDKKEAP